VQALSERAYARNHFSVNTVKQYRKGRNKSEEMEINFDLDRITRDLGIQRPSDGLTQGYLYSGDLLPARPMSEEVMNNRTRLGKVVVVTGGQRPCF